MPAHAEDLALVARIVGGDAEAAEDFERKYRPWFEQIARCSGVPHQDCEDVAQDIFLAALDQMRRGLFRGESALGTWLEKITRGKIIDYWRAGRLKGRLLQPLPADEPGPSVPALKSPAALAADQNLILDVRRALLLLPAQLRIILLLNRVGGYTIEEISRAFGMTRGQVSGRLYKAEEMFRRLIGGEARPREEAGR